VDLSVIIVNYNAGSLLEACLASIRRFGDDLALEILVVDNASTDGSLEALRRFPEAHLIPNRENRGFAAAVNQGIAAAKGRYLLLLNPDTEVVSPVFRALVAFAEVHPDAGVVGPRLRNPDGSLQTSAYRFPTLFQAAGAVLRLRRLVPVTFLRARLGWWLGRYFGQLDPHASPHPVDYVTGACMLIRREVVDRIGGFDPRFFLYFEEKDFCLRAGQAGWRVWFDPAAEVVHHVGGSSRGRPEITVLERMRSMRQFYDKHYGWARRLAVRAILFAGGLLRCAAAVLTGDGAALHAWAGVVGLALRTPRER
jgi:GT2 family glycosyltransferase